MTDSGQHITENAGSGATQMTSEEAAQPTLTAVSWIGDGTALRSIPVGFAFDGCFIAVNGGGKYFWHRASWCGRPALLSAATAHGTNHLGGYSSSALNVKIGLNARNAIYTALFFADNGAGLIKYGSYHGDGVAGREINVDGTPIFVVVKRDNAYPAWIRSRDDDNSYPTLNTAAATNIIALTLNGFTISAAADVNTAVTREGAGGEGYDWLAIMDGPIDWVSQYSGSGAATFTITSGVIPALALFKPHAIDYGALWVKGMPAGKALTLNGSSAFAIGLVSDVTGDVLSLGTGTQVNANGVTTTILTLAESTNPAAAITPASFPAFQVTASAGGAMCGGDASLDFPGNVPYAYEIIYSAPPSTGADFGLIGHSKSSMSYQNLLLLRGGYNGTLEPILQTHRFNSGVIPQPDVAHHVIMTWDGIGQILIWLDGILVKDMKYALTITAMDANTKFTLGAQWNYGGHVLAAGLVGGKIALGRVYNSALTRAQVTARYQRAMFANTAYPDLDYSEEWDASNIVGNTLNASRLTANNGTLSNFTLTTL